MKSGYGYENIFLKHCGLPLIFPFLPCYDHGLSFEDIPSRNSTLNHLSNTYLRWGERIFNNIKSKTSKKPILTGAPFIFYKKENEIKKNTARKTLFFTSHSTDKISQNIGPKDIDIMISKLDHSFRPVDICLHWTDIADKEVYEQMGYNVYSAGKIFDDNFVKNFYEIITNYEFTMSNKLGTYILYSLDLDIPFSLVGQEPLYYNHSNDKNKPKQYKVTDYEYGRKITKLFYGNNLSINEDQKNFMKLETGLNNLIHKKDLKKIITNEFFNSFYSFRGFKCLSKNLAKSAYLKIFR